MENGVQPLPDASTQQAPKQWYKPMTSCEDLGRPSTSLQGLPEKSRTPFHTSGQRGGSPAMSPGSNPTSFVNAQSPAAERSESFKEPPMSTDDVIGGYGSNDSDTSTTTRPSVGGPTRFLNHLLKVSMAHRNVLKCSIAYLIASLFTFSPYLSGFISDLTSYGPGERKPSPSGHMVATIAVYFNPAKTMGAMVEADLFCLLGLLYSSLVCLVSMSMYWWLELKPGWEWLADIVAVAWIGLSMSGVAWMKVWMNNASFNTACSMTAIIIFVVLVKEGGLETLIQVSTIVFFGSAVSNLVCYFIWPQSATSNLQTNLTTTLGSFSTLLTMLTNVFLLENESGMQAGSLRNLQQAVKDHQDSFTTLKKDLSEAQSEWFRRKLPGEKGDRGNKTRNAGRQSYEDAVDSMNRLAQHLNGLRSSTRLQYDLTKAGITRDNNKKLGKASAVHTTGQIVEEDEITMLSTAVGMFGDLVEELGPPLKALSGACTSTLQWLRDAFLKSQSVTQRKRDVITPHEFTELIDDINRALVLFESTSNHAVLRLYRRSDANHTSSSNPQNTVHGENSLLTGPDHEHVFLVYFFIFTLQEFARELVSLVDAMERIYTFEQARLVQRSFWWKVFVRIGQTLRNIRHWGKSGKSSQGRSGLRRTLSVYIIPEHRAAHPFFPKIRPHAPNTIQTPSRDKLSFWRKMKRTIWEIGIRLTERDAKYAIKAGMATAILSAPAFFDATRPTFVKYYGDWALISYFIVISPTIGATNYLSLQRVLGTLFGAAVAAATYSFFPEDAVFLAVFGFIFSLPCFYFAVVKPQYLSASRFVLLTYNLTCLYCYNLREKDVSVLDVALYRALAVTVGVLWAAFISRFWWPAEARRELSRALGEFCLNIGWLYTRLVASNSFAPEYHHQHECNEDSEISLLPGRVPTTRLNNSIQEFMSMELHLQIKLIELQTLLAQAQHEPRLKGPFPVQLYRNVLTGLQAILDNLHSMRCVTTREEWYTSVRQDFIVPVNKERHEMVGNIILSFSTLASAFRLKAPLPPYLPPVEKSRQRLVDAIRRLDVVKNRDVKGSRQLLFFAYALAMKGVTQELESLGRTLQNAFGVIGQTSDEFEALFMVSEERQRIINYVA